MADQALNANWNAEGPKLGMQALWRLAIWGTLATFALLAAVISGYSSAGSQRQSTSIGSGQRPSAQAPSTQGPPGQGYSSQGPSGQVTSGQVTSGQGYSGQASFGQASFGQASSGQGPTQPRTAASEFGARPNETAEETRRLAEAVRTLTVDRDQALARIAALE